MSNQINVDLKKVLGKTGVKVSPIGFGTLNIRDFINAEKAMLKAIEYGINIFEVSETYANGLALDYFGRFLAKIKREDVFIVFRVSPLILADPDSFETKFNKFLQKMNTSYVDALMIGWYEDAIPLETQLTSLERAAERGYAKFIGVSGFKVKQIARVLNMPKKYEISLIQNRYNVMDKRIEKDVLPFAMKNNIAVLACSALDGGQAIRQPVVMRIASKYNATGAQIALSYVISNPNVVALVKSENIDHVVEDVTASKTVLKEEDLSALRSM